MTTNTITLIVLAAVLGAVLLDLFLLRRVRHYLKEHGVGENNETQGVYLLGVYSPLLTWLKYRRLPGWEQQGSASEREPLEKAQEQKAHALSVPEPVATITRRERLVEWGLIVLLVFLYTASFLDLGKPTTLSGNESEVFQSLDWTLVTSLRQYGRFPLWNPFLGGGIPYIADPMLHIFNPVSTLPVLLFGVQNGFKVGVALSFLIGALGMWRLGAVLGMGQKSRLWVALMYAFAGQPAARFFQGQYLFILGFAWIPWVVSNLFMIVKRGRRTDWVATALTLALLFFSGNVYYSFYMLVFIGFFAIIYGVGFQLRKPFVKVEPKLALTLIIVGVLTLGVIAVQLLPMAEFWPRLSKSLEVAGSHSLQQIYLDYTSKDPYRPDAYGPLPAREEFYAYIGKIPFTALALLPYALWKRERRTIILFSSMLLFTILWISLDVMPWYDAFLRAKIFLQFRHLLRILIYGSFSILLLGGLALDTVDKLLEEQAQRIEAGFWGKARNLAANAGLVVVSVGMLFSAFDVYQTNRKHLLTEETNDLISGALHWLRQYDLTDYYVRVNPNNTAQDSAVAAGLRLIEVWYHFGDIRKLEGSYPSRPVQAKPNYIIQTPGEPLLNSPDVILVQKVNSYDIVFLPENLPYAFSIPWDRLSPQEDNDPVQRSEVVAQTSFTPSPNAFEVIASAQPDEMLVVLTQHYPGWELRVDGRPSELLNVNGYLAARMLPGVHKYEFTFKPRSFYVGLVLSLLSTGLLLALLISDTRQSWQSRLAWLRATPQRVRGLQQQTAEQLWAGRLETQAVYRQGSLVPEQPLNLQEDSPIQLVVEPLAAQATPLTTAWRRWGWATGGLAGALVKAIPLAGALFVLALGIYAFTRLFALERFPIYFFGDEAVQVLFAETLVTQRFHSADGTLFPIYVEAAGNRWTPLLSMYVHALSMSLFGKTIVVSRATSALVSLLGAGAVGLILKRVFKARFAWTGVLLLAVTPAWFLHSRTAFETVMTAAFYACFLLFYLLYRTESPRYLYAAVIFGAATFYSYSNAQAIILAAALLLLISDWRYHLQNRQVVIKGLVLAAFLAIPFVEFRLSRPQAISEHLRTVGSYWYQDLPVSQKLLTFTQKYLYGLSPLYWFIPNSHDLARHRMQGIGQIHILALPLVLLGLSLCVAKWRSSPHRTLVLAALATPVGAALVDVGIARVLSFVIPAALLAALGLEWLLERLKDRVSYPLTALAVFAVLAWGNFALLRTALVEGPLWFSDYGLYGMQYGARQLFEEAIPEFLGNEPDTDILVSSTWANGADNFIPFFFTPEEQRRVRMDGVENYLYKKLPLDENMLFVMTPSEYEKARTSEKIGSVRVEKLIPYPDGTPGFYFVRLAYAKNVDAVFQAEAEVRRTLVTDFLTIDGQTVELHYSQIDMGLPALMFDGDLFTLMRGMEANPFVLEFYFPEARTVSGIDADFGLVNITLTVQLFSEPDAEPIIYNATYLNTTGKSHVVLDLAKDEKKYRKVRLEILNTLSGETANIHIRELRLLP